ncbi:hypothetical protein D3C77_649750 [compost metagenome]
MESSVPLPWSAFSSCMPKAPPSTPEPKAFASAWPPSRIARSMVVPAVFSPSTPVAELAAQTFTVLPGLKRIGIPGYCLTRMLRHMALSPWNSG